MGFLFIPRTFIAWLKNRASGVWEALPWRRPAIYRYRVVEDLPDRYSKGIVYLVGEGENLWAAALKCPCGCGDVIELNLLAAARPRWAAQMHPDRTVSLAPSVWRQKACKSHFVMRQGHVRWC